MDHFNCLFMHVSIKRILLLTEVSTYQSTMLVTYSRNLATGQNQMLRQDCLFTFTEFLRASWQDYITLIYCSNNDCALFKVFFSFTESQLNSYITAKMELPSSLLSWMHSLNFNIVLSYTGNMCHGRRAHSGPRRSWHVWNGDSSWKAVPLYSLCWHCSGHVPSDHPGCRNKHWGTWYIWVRLLTEACKIVQRNCVDWF